ncbi:hypothetical protein LCM20_16915 [Halobacillus litoralis]|uniref:hypothetical protein n=1 Tax=Halobacillus litoralis TaxID=45668 RepID=UPI001CD1F079|nr:hypothetical protein [Halobacillus litoralis]MCA0972291.1 hypothetical protein [Halobacillus litoralis]
MVIILRKAAVAVIVVLLVVVAFLKMNPPLAHGSVGTTNNNQYILLSVGNKHTWGSIHIKEVRINGKSEPSRFEVQVSDTNKGLLMADLSASSKAQIPSEREAAIRLLPNSFPKMDETGPQDTEHTIYGLSLSEDTPIERIEVSYTYLGLTFEETIQI